MTCFQPADVVEVRVADAANKDADLHVLFGRIASRNRGQSQRRCRTLSRVSLRVIHIVIPPIILLRP